MAGKNVDDKLRCSFCNKTQNQVKKLIAGPNGAYICDECVGICSEILDEEFLDDDKMDESDAGLDINLLKPKEIKEFLDSPDFNQEETIAQQIKLLELQYKHIGELISFAREIQTKGVKTMNFEVFDTNEIEQYKAEVKSKWGNSKAYQEYEQRVVSHSEHNDSKFVNEIMSLFTDLGAMKQLPPTDKAVQEKIAALQAYINENFYTCSNDILKELGEMYVCDDRFKKNIDRFGGEGTAKFVREAIFVYCEK